jgi:hypothetical protein
MDSTQNPANAVSEAPFSAEETEGTLSTGEWADLIYSDIRHSYHVHQLQPNVGYSGITECWTDDEARTIFAELLDRFCVYRLNRFPLPPSGLPGFREAGFSQEDRPAKLLELGLRYAVAIIRNERRAMHLRWQDAEEFIRKTEQGAEQRIELREIRRQMEEAERRTAQEQHVYFIGSASGPIKIGIAARPQERLSTLQTGHHEKLELLATCEGGQKQERAYHARFADHRLQGEWFERCPAIEAEIARLSAPNQSETI